MNYCKSCKVKIATPAEHCPLCQGPLEQKNASPQISVEQTYPHVEYSHFSVGLIQKLSWGLLLVLSALLWLDSLMQLPSVWAATGIAFFCYLAASILYTVKSRQSAGYALLRTVVLICAVAVAVDVATGFSQWSTTYVLPFVMIVASFLITSIILVKPQWFREYFVYQLVLLTLTLLTVLFYSWGLANQDWPGKVAMVYALVMVCQLFSYYGRISLLELRKRLHL